jgi:hypothetical protein
MRRPDFIAYLQRDPLHRERESERHFEKLRPTRRDAYPTFFPLAPTENLKT